MQLTNASADAQLQTPLRTGDLLELVKHNKGESVGLLVRAKRLGADLQPGPARDKRKKQT